MRDLLILGHGIHGVEMAEIVERINRALPMWNLLGFISPAESETGTTRNGYPVIGSPAALERFPDACLVPDNEWPRDLPILHDRLVSVIDPTVFVSRTAQIATGCVLYPNCFVGANAVVGEFVLALAGCTINHDCVLGDRVVLASSVTLAGSVQVEDDCYLGQSCTIRQGIRIGRGSTIGLGAVVVKDVEPGSVIVGNPGRPMSRRD